jgi:hypothetical protein
VKGGGGCVGVVSIGVKSSEDYAIWCCIDGERDERDEEEGGRDVGVTVYNRVPMHHHRGAPTREQNPVTHPQTTHRVSSVALSDFWGRSHVGKHQPWCRSDKAEE